MVTRETEGRLREIFRSAVENACEDISNRQVVEGWWPEGYAERFAELMTQSVALMAESCEMAEENCKTSR